MQKGLGSNPSPTQTGVKVQAGNPSFQEEETVLRNSWSFLATFKASLGYLRPGLKQ